MQKVMHAWLSGEVVHCCQGEIQAAEAGKGEHVRYGRISL